MPIQNHRYLLISLISDDDMAVIQILADAVTQMACKSVYPIIPITFFLLLKNMLQK